MRRAVRGFCGGVAGGVLVGGFLAGNWPAFVLGVWSLTWVATWEPF